MSKRIFATARYAALALLLGATGPAQAACLAAPDAAAPDGQHWRYRVDRVTKQNCWYLREAGPLVRPSDPARASRASRVSSGQATNDGSPLNKESREALFREFLQWRKSQPPP